MKTAIVFSSGTGNTKLLAETIQATVGDVAYYGEVSDEALSADVIYIGSWTKTGYTCTPDIKKFLCKVRDKKVFLFMTAGFGSSDAYFEPIMYGMKSFVDGSNEVIGEFICQGKVSEMVQNVIKEGNEVKYNRIKEEMDKSVSHPDKADTDKLIAAVKKVM
ncbi:MAG: flavodoxin family protein [Bacillota bacterium]